MRSHWNGVFELFQNRESQKPEKFRGTINPTNKPRKEPEQEQRQTRQRHNTGRDTSNATTQQANGKQRKPATRKSSHDRHKSTAENDDTETQQTAPTPYRHPTQPTPTQTRHRTHANPPTHAPRHQRQTPATTGPAPSLENTKKIQQSVWCYTTISHRARDMPSKDELALFGCFGPLWARVRLFRDLSSVGACAPL